MHESAARSKSLDKLFGPLISDADGVSNTQVERCYLPSGDEGMKVQELIQLLRERGHKRLFVEGGGVTVSRFFESGCLTHLQVAIAPVLVGEGISALQLKGVDKMLEAHRPRYSIYRMGEDILWDFALDSNLKPSREQESLKSERQESVFQEVFVQKILSL